MFKLALKNQNALVQKRLHKSIKKAWQNMKHMLYYR
jgi:hypothetical protein